MMNTNAGDVSESSTGEAETRAGYDSSRKSHSDINSEETLDERKEAEREVCELANSATSRINCARWLVFSLIVVFGAIVSYYTYYILYNQEHEDYEQGVKLFLETLETTTVATVWNFYNAMEELSETVSLSSDLSRLAADFTSTRFPFVTVDLFESRARHVREQAGFGSVFWAPIVKEDQMEEWSEYVKANQGWLNDCREFDLITAHTYDREDYEYGDFIDYIYENPRHNVTGELLYVPPTYPGPYAPLWQVSPPPIGTKFVNHDKFDKTFIRNAFEAVKELRVAVYTDFFDLRQASSLQMKDEVHLAFHQQFTDEKLTIEMAYQHPHSMIISPVFSRVGDRASAIVGIAGAIISWDRYLVNLLPEGVSGIDCVLESDCGDIHSDYTYRLHGDKATFLGKGDLHDPAYDHTAHTISLMDPDVELQDVPGNCMYSLTAYSSAEYEKSSVSSLPVVVSVTVSMVFLIVLLFFFLYDRFVKRRNDLVIDAATRSNAVLLQLFPKNVRDRMLNEKANEEKVSGFMRNGHSGDGKPNADLFPETTIMFADLAGFTSWSSEREPAQVFILLETLYQSFDEIAKKRRVFKVETIGDCYVAVCGLPEPNKDHAVTMVRFAQGCMDTMHTLVRELEVTLGPGTGDLDLRIGLHSGPTTAGVLRGDRARFQLFGDTMNTASRMESSGVAGRIQISEATAKLLVNAGKGKWLTKREGTIFARGKGVLSTYFVSPRADRNSTGSASTTSEDSTRMCEKLAHSQGDKHQRIIDWIMDLALPLMKEIVARRNAFGTPTVYDPELTPDQLRTVYNFERERGQVDTILVLPQKFYSSISNKEMPDSSKVEVSPLVLDELRAFVTKLCSTYNDNEFHNFEHAGKFGAPVAEVMLYGPLFDSPWDLGSAHVMQCAYKLLSRIVGGEKSGVLHHENSFGITSDPLTHFSAVLAALAHDADHSGVPNAQLVKENQPLAAKYGNKSVAEQHSFDIFWKFFMMDEFKNFRKVICCNDKAHLRFHDMMLNLLTATDIADKDLKKLRDARWTRAFPSEQPPEDDDEHPDITTNRRATIVLEYIIQASDISHTMQHWMVYRKWNQAFFFECTKAYIQGRAEKDPKDYWYEGEIGFFDYYIIPLAQKLVTCGVFGVSSDELLNYAQANRAEWAERGRAVVAEMVEAVKEQPWYQPGKEVQIPVIDDVYCD